MSLIKKYLCITLLTTSSLCYSKLTADHHACASGDKVACEKLYAKSLEQQKSKEEEKKESTDKTEYVGKPVSAEVEAIHKSHGMKLPGVNISYLEISPVTQGIEHDKRRDMVTLKQEIASCIKEKEQQQNEQKAAEEGKDQKAAQKGKDQKVADGKSILEQCTCEMKSLGVKILEYHFKVKDNNAEWAGRKVTIFGLPQAEGLKSTSKYDLTSRGLNKVDKEIIKLNTCD